MGCPCLHHREGQSDEETVEGETGLDLFALKRMAIVERIEILQRA